MFRQFALVAAFACVALAMPRPDAVPENFEDIPAEYKAMIPDEVAQHLKDVTPEEKAVLKELAKNYKDYKNEDEFLEAIKAKSPSLHEKAQKLHNLIKDKVEKLGTEARAFVKEVLADGRKIHAQYLAGEKPSLETLKTSAKTHIDAYKKLSDEAKTQFKEQFPILTSVFQNDKIQALVDKYIN
ncbi:unnamed protein product [Caenorhabditis auriculariae]|uniref:Fatty-acid and retinol-binding protein 1 n=1 Tax=Caenorhabditis auriculariae TaxID=2777116 RepID=A0A8S1HUA1_9PELO|nr:unnamed protein product [Caenorhabditis auriculariae]